MKEKLKKNLKKILIIILIILLSPIFIYLLIDGKNLFVDMYNFRQLDKAKHILESIGDKDERFFGLNEFNEKYNTNVKSIKNCYYINNNNGKYPYMFGFKLESYIYTYIYKDIYFSYPGYDLPIKLAGSLRNPINPDNFNPDSTRRIFENIISNPCRD